MAAIRFAEFTRKQGDLVIVLNPGTTHPVIVGNAVERLASGNYRVYFSFVAQGKLFDSSATCTEDQIEQVVRNGIMVWSKLGS